MDKFNLERFVRAQESIYQKVLSELGGGKKRTHWMWFIFPQLRSLGVSERSYFYGISGVEEAKAYLAHPILGSRLAKCCEALMLHTDKTATELLGAIDSKKLRSSMTLFAAADQKNPLFRQVLNSFFDGVEDEKTKIILKEKTL